MKKELVSLQFAYYEENFEQNLNNFIKLLEQTSKNSIVCAPELCLTNFSFSHMQKAADFSKSALDKILKHSLDKVICFTLTEEKNGKFYNSAKIIADGKIIHSQNKYKLFKFGDEDIYFEPGNENQIKIIKYNGIKFATLICFELRFIDLWKKIQGADIIFIPALWGKLRKKQLEILSLALGVANQCFVIVANSKNSDMASSSSIITPFGERVKNDKKDMLILDANLKEIKKMRRYMDVGIKS